MQANLWHKLFHVNLPFWIWREWKGREKITKTWISWEWKELVRWNKKTFFIVFEGLSLDVLGLLYFFRFHFVFLFVKSYVGWEVSALVSHVNVFCFQSKGGESKKFEDWGCQKILGLGGGYLFEEGATFARGGGQYPITCHVYVFGVN